MALSKSSEPIALINLCCDRLLGLGHAYFNAIANNETNNIIIAYACAEASCHSCKHMQSPISMESTLLYVQVLVPLSGNVDALEFSERTEVCMASVTWFSATEELTPINNNHKSSNPSG